MPVAPARATASARTRLLEVSMLSVEDNELLCRVEGDAAMGQLMRRHWIPACLSEEVAERTKHRGKLCELQEDVEQRAGSWGFRSSR